MSNICVASGWYHISELLFNLIYCYFIIFAAFMRVSSLYKPPWCCFCRWRTEVGVFRMFCVFDLINWSRLSQISQTSLSWSDWRSVMLMPDGITHWLQVKSVSSTHQSIFIACVKLWILWSCNGRGGFMSVPVREGGAKNRKWEKQLVPQETQKQRKRQKDIKTDRHTVRERERDR